MIVDNLSLTEIELLFKGLILIVIFMTLYLGTLFTQNKTLISKVNKMEKLNRHLLETLDLKEFPDGIDNSYW